ncbi:MAG: DMT family transporter [Anaerolineaceae bacterium]|nr:DMT family transporter [Anaerolineaceae bacterium]
MGILAVSTASIFIRFAQETTPSLVIAAYRLGLASLILAPIALIRKRRELRTLKLRQFSLAMLSGAFLALHFATWITSLQYTSVASSVVLVTTNPLWVALLSPIFLRERPKRAVLVGLALALGGGVVVSLADSCSLSTVGITCPSAASFFQGTAFLGDFLALAGAWFAAGYLMIGRSLRRKMSLTSYTFLVYGMASVVLLVVTGVGRLPLSGYPAPTYLWLVLLALVPQLFGHTTFNWALRYLPAAYVSIALLGEPVGSTILAYFLLRETPNSIKLAGGVLILVGIFITSRSSNQ